MYLDKVNRASRSIFTLNRKREFITLHRMLNLNSNDTLLDIGSGDGYWTRRLAKRCQIVVGLEPDDELRRYAETMFIHPRVTYHQGTAEAIPYPNEYFSKIMSISCFEHFADQEMAMQEIRRVLRPGGTVALSVDSLLPENSSKGFRDWHRHKHRVTRYFTVSEMYDLFQRNKLSYDDKTTTSFFHSHIAGQLRQIFVRHTKWWLPLYPVFYAGVRLGDGLFHDQPGQIIVLRATG